MLQSPIKPSSYSLRGDRRSSPKKRQADEMDSLYAGGADDDYDGDQHSASGGAAGGTKQRGKSRRELPTGAVATLKAWLLSPEHFTHPYPTPQDQAMLMAKTGIDKKQLKNWFTNARRRIWKPMLKKQIEEGKFTAAGAPGVAGAGTLIMPGAASSQDNPHSVQAMRVHYQQASQDIQNSQQQQQQQQAPASLDGFTISFSTNQAETGTPASQLYGTGDGIQSLVQSGSIGTLAQVSSSAQLSKTDSHAVLMELFARDQDLVRQATESARLKAENKQQPAAAAAASSGTQQQQPQPAAAPSSQHPMIKAPAPGVLQDVPSLSSWPHFSSITSLNNLGTIPGVKSIASLSGTDLANKGNVNKMGNLAQVKSMESMGKNDSYAFLEVFFGDRSSGNLAGMGGGASSTSHPKGMGKQGGDEDNEIGLSLDDESPSQAAVKKDLHSSTAPAPSTAAPSTGMMIAAGQLPPDAGAMDAGTLKRAYDDALAARGLMSVSRSCEKLTDLPAKIQRTLSESLLHKEQEQQAQQAQQSTQTSTYTPYTPASTANGQQQSNASQPQQYAGQQPAESQAAAATAPVPADAGSSTATTPDGHVQVSSSTTCSLCGKTNVDTQLRPCGHMFHERCLKPSIQNPLGQPKCPVEDIPIHSVVMAVPEANSSGSSNTTEQQKQEEWTYSNPQSVKPTDGQ